MTEVIGFTFEYNNSINFSMHLVIWFVMSLPLEIFISL